MTDQTRKPTAEPEAVPERKRELIKSLNLGERDLYAEMLMRSLRGSWNRPRARAEILCTIGKVGGLLVYDDDSIRDKAALYIAKGEEWGQWDGRTFRSCYGRVNIADYDEQIVRIVASNIPDDMMWDDFRISKEMEDD